MIFNVYRNHSLSHSHSLVLGSRLEVKRRSAWSRAGLDQLADLVKNARISTGWR